MSLHRSFSNFSSILLLAVCAFGVADYARAGFTFLGPTSYLSAADSPFPVDGSNPNFYLEDFEPDMPCVPGGSTFCGAIPSEFPGIKRFFGGAA